MNLQPTRESWRALACYVVAPARKLDSGRIGLVPIDDGFTTPPLRDESRVAVVGDRIHRADQSSVAITTMRNAAEFVGVTLSSDPGVGKDLPRYEPDVPLTIDTDAGHALAEWWLLGLAALDALRAELTVSDATLWPEHFDFAATVETDQGTFNLGASPGDGWSDEPYLYVGPWDASLLTDPFWDAPFGRALKASALDGDAGSGRHRAAAAFFEQAVRHAT